VKSTSGESDMNISRDRLICVKSRTIDMNIIPFLCYDVIHKRNAQVIPGCISQLQGFLC
jgi:hypothetical protein